MIPEKVALWFRTLLFGLLSVLLASCGSGSGEDSVEVSEEETEAARYELVFADYFGDPPGEDSLGTARALPREEVPAGNWIIDVGYGPDGDGHGNDEWQLYTDSMENVYTEDGKLVLRASCSNGATACTDPNVDKRGGTITSGKVYTKDRVNVRYGKIRARIKMPSGKGMWPAFWMLGADIDETPWPDAGEIDIVEMHYYYSDTRTTHFSLH